MICDDWLIPLDAFVAMNSKQGKSRRSLAESKLTFINGGTYYYPFVFMLIRPTGLALVEVFFSDVPIAARLIRLISIKTKEY